MTLTQEIKNQLKCVFLNHIISDDDEWYMGTHNELRTICPRCRYPLFIYKKDDGCLYFRED